MVPREAWLALVVFVGLPLTLLRCALPSYSVDESVGGAGGIGGMLDSCVSVDNATDMVPLPGGYCIDRTEVTWKQYNLWATTADTAGQRPECQWNVDFSPGMACVPPQPGDEETQPVACVDWCDASAYCEAVGKQLCGKIGGGPSDPTVFADPNQSEWHNACTSGGKHSFPHGSSYDPQTCNTAEGTGEPEAIGVHGGCQSSEVDYAGVFDLSGNVAEWVAHCDDISGDSDACRARGGSYESTGSQAACAAVSSWDRKHSDPAIGIRCCWAP